MRLEIGASVANSLTSVNKDSMIIYAILAPCRTDQEKERRRLCGDKGAKFSNSKYLAPRTDGISNTLTSVAKDNLLLRCEDNTDRQPI